MVISKRSIALALLLQSSSTFAGLSRGPFPTLNIYSPYFENTLPSPAELGLP